ncbi:nitrogenase component 1 [Candidatus Absconditicoccus praedator]|uniref:nitrogenase component 1 n=1 Tax=Candidatus Absconditicoccus praedator TaxID=2735562 RepID=UPI001E28EE96|nr:nitrogenase component 1 [Candidatus Absconditicoccus praedator]UFX83312.1 hypothetical protein HLG78_04245 [Candidatus Absconditicoccus praedator]
MNRVFFGDYNAKKIFEKLFNLKNLEIKFISATPENIGIFIQKNNCSLYIKLKNNDGVCVIDSNQKQDDIFIKAKEFFEKKSYYGFFNMIKKNSLQGSSLDINEQIVGYIDACFIMGALRSHQKFQKKELDNILDFTFFSDYVYERKARDTLDYEFSSCYINHSELECYICNAESLLGGSSKGMSSFFEFEDQDNYSSDFYESDYVNEDGYFTNITQHDTIVEGGIYKIEEILDNLDFEKYDVITINQTCTPSIIGDDLRSLIKRYQKKTNTPIVYKDQNAFDSYKELEVLVKKNKNSHKIKNSLIYVGVGDYDFIEESSNLFGGIGIRFNGNIVPKVNKKLIDMYGRSETQVLFKSDLNEELNHIFDDTGKITIYENIPYGLENSINFYNRIVGNFYNNFDEDLKNYFHKQKEQFDFLKNYTKKFGVGFLITPQKINDFFGVLRGVPIINFFREMGFKINVLFYSEHMELNSIIYNNIQEKNLDDKINYEITNSNTVLEKFLLREDIDIYYSEMYNDSRILNKDKFQFSHNDLYYGVSGAVYSQKKLLKLCESRKKIKNLYYI